MYELQPPLAGGAPWTENLKRAGKRISSPVAHLFKFRGDKVAHYQNFLNTAAFVSAGSAASGVVVSFTPPDLTAESYAEVLRRLNQVTTLPPAGGIFHVCYGEPGNLRVTDVFDSMESFEAFAKVLRPIIDALGIHAGAPEIKPVHSAGPWPH